MATATQQARKWDREKMGSVGAAVMALVALTAQPASADIRPSRLVAKALAPAASPLEPIRVIGATAPGGGILLAGGASPQLRTVQALSRVATIDAYCSVEMSGDSSADQAFLLYVDGRLVAHASMTVMGGGAAAEVPVLQATIRLPAMRQQHMIRVVLDGTFSNERTWIMTL